MTDAALCIENAIGIVGCLYAFARQTVITQLQLRIACARNHKRCQPVFEVRTAKPQQCVLQDMHGAASDILEVLDKDIGQASFRWYASICAC
jgi:hypothetical protein